MATAAQTRTTRRRGRVAVHDVDTLLDLVAEVARAAQAVGEATTAAAVSMPAFDRVKLDVDQGRGIADARSDPERTPTADAIQRRFREIAREPVRWSLIVEQALRDPQARTMWLAALGRDEARHDLTDRLVALALRRVATERRAASLAPGDYHETQEALVAADKARYGDDGLMERSCRQPTRSTTTAAAGTTPSSSRDWNRELRSLGHALAGCATLPSPA